MTGPDTAGPEQPSTPLYGDAPLPGTRTPTRWTLLRGVKITLALFVVAGLLFAFSGVLVVGYVNDTNNRITSLERYLAERKRVGEERDATTRRLITEQQEKERLEKCAILSRIPVGQDRSADEFRRALRCGAPAVNPTSTPRSTR